MSHVAKGVHRDAGGEVRGKLLAQPIGASAVDPEHDGGDPLRQQRHRRAPAVHVEVGVAVHVDEAGGDVEPADVDGVARDGAVSEGEPEPRDAAAAEPDVLSHPRISCAVEHASVDEENVERLLTRPLRTRRRGREAQDGDGADATDHGRL